MTSYDHSCYAFVQTSSLWCNKKLLHTWILLLLLFFLLSLLLQLAFQSGNIESTRGDFLNIKMQRKIFFDVLLGVLLSTFWLYNGHQMSSHCFQIVIKCVFFLWFSNKCWFFFAPELFSFTFSNFLSTKSSKWFLAVQIEIVNRKFSCLIETTTTKQQKLWMC